MITETGKCPLCGKIGKIVNSNNPLVKGSCVSCLNVQIDYKNLKQAEFFCRTYNLPWLPDRWLEIAEETQAQVFEYYCSSISEEYKPNLYYNSGTADLWSKTNEEWKKVLDHRELIQRIKPIKESFIQQMQIKWGPQYSFEQFIHLEDVYSNTVKRAGITNPITLDIVKKIAVVSTAMDSSLAEGDIKGAAEYSKMHKSLVDSAGLDKMIEVGNSDNINNLSDLCDFMEKNKFTLNWQIPDSRDIVDATIKDMQEWTINFFRDSLGLQQTYDIVENSYRSAMETKSMDTATKSVNLEEIMDSVKQGLNKELDDAIEKEDYEVGDIDDDGTY